MQLRIPIKLLKKIIIQLRRKKEERRGCGLQKFFKIIKYRNKRKIKIFFYKKKNKLNFINKK